MGGFNLPPLTSKITASDEEFRAALNRAAAAAQSFTSKMNAAGTDAASGMGKVTTSTIAVGSAIGVLGSHLALSAISGFKNLGVSAIKAGADMEQSEILLRKLTGSAAVAGRIMAQLKDMAVRTPFNFPDLLTGVQRLKAFGFETEKLIPTIRTLGDATAAMGAGPDVLFRIAKALADVRNSSKLSEQDFRQFANAGINAWQLVSDASGKSAAQIKADVKSGLMTTAEVADLILAGIAKRYGGTMEEVAKTTKGMLSNVQDAWKFALADIGKALDPLTKKIIGEFLMPAASGASELAKAFSTLPGPVQGASIAITGVGLSVAALGTLIGPLITNFGLLATALGVGRLALLGWVGTAALAVEEILRVGFAYHAMKDAQKAAERAGKDSEAALIKLADSLKARGVPGVQELTTAWVKGTISQTEYQKKLGALAVELGNTVKQSGPVVRAQTAQNQGLAGGSREAARYAAEMARVQASLQRVSATKIFIPPIPKITPPDFGEWPEVTSQISGHISEIGAELNRLAGERVDAALILGGGGWAETAEQVLRVGVAINSLGPAAAAASASFDELGATIRAINPAIDALGIGDLPLMIGATQEEIDLGRELSDMVLPDIERAMRNAGVAAQEVWSEKVPTATRRTKSGLLEVSTVITDMSRGIARSIVDWKGFGEVANSVVKSIGEAILREIIQNIIKSTGLVQTLGKVLNATLGKIPGIGKIFNIGGGGDGEGIPGVGGAPGIDLGGGGGGAAGGAAGAAGSAAAGWIGAIGSAVTAISSVIGNFQFAHMNTALGRIEESTRKLWIITGEQGDSIWWASKETALWSDKIHGQLDTIRQNTWAMLSKMDVGVPVMAAQSALVSATMDPLNLGSIASLVPVTSSSHPEPIDISMLARTPVSMDTDRGSRNIQPGGTFNIRIEGDSQRIASELATLLKRLGFNPV